MNKPIERGKFKVLYNETSNSTKVRRWLKRSVSKLRRIDKKEQVRKEVEDMEEEE